jgi:hypothetical protein
VNDDIAHADTLRPPAPSPWMDAPTHDGLWWVNTGNSIEIMDLARRPIAGTVWWRRDYIGSEDFDTERLPSGWKFAPAVPPALP